MPKVINELNHFSKILNLPVFKSDVIPIEAVFTLIY